MGNLPLRNLKNLRNDMMSQEKAVVVFRFKYKNKNYFIAVCLLTEDDKKKNDAEFALVRLCFMKADNLADYLDCYAHSNGLTSQLSELRKYLGVEFQPDAIGWIDGFLTYLGKSIPQNVPSFDSVTKEAAIYTLCRHEKRDPNRIYRLYMFRNGIENGKQKHRTEYNAQLASEKFPMLYPRFANDKTVSFAFTDDASKEKDEIEILSNFEKNERA